MVILPVFVGLYNICLHTPLSPLQAFFLKHFQGMVVTTLMLLVQATNPIIGINSQTSMDFMCAWGREYKLGSVEQLVAQMD